MINIIVAVILMLVLLLMWESIFTWICFQLINLINDTRNPYVKYHSLAFVGVIIVMVISAVIGIGIIINYIKQSGI